jgi:hypothetical protein
VSELTVFYSWQSDLPNRTNRNFVETALENACKTIQKDADLKVQPVVDRDTSGIAGAPDISEAIFSKISRAFVFVGDVTLIPPAGSVGIVARYQNGLLKRHRPKSFAPNPNVLVELGYALHVLGDNRVILVLNQVYGTPDLLPFDLRKRRVLNYESKPKSPDRPKERRSLETKLAEALRAVVAESSIVKGRILDPAKSAIAKSLSSSPGRKVGICTFLPAREEDREKQAALATDFAEAFTRGGWNSILNSNVRMSINYSGVLLVAYDGNNPPSNPDFGPIEAAFQIAGIPYRLMRLRDQSPYFGPVSTSDPVVYLGPAD